jgi:cytidylate kinase
MEGRDIGTVIAPRADLKIFLTASLEVRAERRFKQLKEEGKECIFSQIFDQLKERDRRDSERDVAPMLPAEEAIVIDTSNLTLQEVIEEINDYITRAS